MILSNCHTHTNYCDGKNTAEEMVVSAIEKGFVSIGISSHSPMRGGCEWAMQVDEVDSYINEINSLKERYKNKIQVYCGIELDNNFAGIDLKKFDYSIGSVHQFIKDNKVYEVDYTPEKLKELTDNLFDGNWNEMAKAYFNLLADFVIDNNVDVVGHFDLITKFNDDNRQFDTENAQYRKYAIDAIDRILASKPEILFEVNTGAMSRCGNKYPYPSRFILDYLYKKGARITITGDSHSCDTIDYGYDTAVTICKECGFKSVYVLKDGKFVLTDL